MSASLSVSFLRTPAALAALAFAALSSAPAVAGEVRVMCYQDGVECDVTAEIAKKFEAANPNIKIVLDVVPYKTIVEQLPVQLGAGQGPDIARVTDLGGLSKHYLDVRPHLKDAAYFETNFGATLPWLRPGAADKGIYGFMSQLTMTGPYVNKTLFDQAKVPMPDAKATWDQWADATKKVAQATQTKAAMAWDRSGHRFAGPAISYGAKIFDGSGNLALDDGYKAAVNKFVGWHKDGTMLKEVWAGSGGCTYADSIGEFTNGRVVMVLSGSWQINRLQKDVGNNFDWVAVPNPCGPAACTGIPGGAAWVALKTSEVAARNRGVPRVHGERSERGRVHRTHQQHPGARGAGEEGRRLQDCAARGEGGVVDVRQGRRGAVAGGLSVPGLPLQPRDHVAHRGTRHAGDRRRDQRGRRAGEDQRRHGGCGEAGAEVAAAS